MGRDLDILRNLNAVSASAWMRRNDNLTPSEKVERIEMDVDGERISTYVPTRSLNAVPEGHEFHMHLGDDEAAVEQLMEDLATPDETVICTLAVDESTASMLMGAVSAAVRGDLELMKQQISALDSEEVSTCYQAVNVVLANLLAKDAAGKIDSYK